MAFTEKRRPELKDDLGLLIGDLCSQWGFCNSLVPEDLVRTDCVLTATEFADAILRAEGMNPEYELHWRRRITRLFVARYGAETSPEEYAMRVARHRLL